MIKTLLKHIAAETAVNAMFQSLNKNFITHMNIPTVFKVGQIYSKIEIQYCYPRMTEPEVKIRTTIYDCVIETVHYITAELNAKPCAISISSPYAVIIRNLAEHTKTSFYIDNTYMVEIDHIIDIE